LKGLSLNDIYTCKVVKYKAYNWNEGVKMTLNGTY
jgi:hypothetical protein